MSSPTPPPVLSVRRRAVVLAAAAAALALASGLWLRTRASPPPPPLPDLSDADPEVVEVVRGSRDALLKQPRSSAAWGRLGTVLRAHDFGPEANQCFEEAERLDPAEPRWPYLRGLTLVMTDPEAGVPCLERAARLCPAGPLAPRLRLADVLLEQGRLDETRSHLEEALRREPGNLRARFGLGRLALLRQDYRAAVEHLEACRDDVCARKRAHSLLAEAWSRLGQPERARAEQRRAAELPDDEAWPDPFVESVMRLRVGLRYRLERAGSLLAGREFDEAIGLLEDTARRYPESVRAWLLLGGAWRTLGRADRAEQAYREAVRADPEAAEGWFELGCVQALDPAPSRQREAADSFRRAVRLKPDHALAHFNLGHRLRLLGDPGGAADEFRRALRCRPDYAPAREALRQLEAPPAPG